MFSGDSIGGAKANLLKVVMATIKRRAHSVFYQPSTRPTASRHHVNKHLPPLFWKRKNRKHSRVFLFFFLRVNMCFWSVTRGLVSLLWFWLQISVIFYGGEYQWIGKLIMVYLLFRARSRATSLIGTLRLQSRVLLFLDIFRACEVAWLDSLFARPSVKKSFKLGLLGYGWLGRPRRERFNFFKLDT